jgi:hypothetical protein
LTMMLTTERITKLQWTCKLSRADEKSRPINLPLAFCFPHLVPPLENSRDCFPVCYAVFGWLEFFLKVKRIYA